MDWPTNNRSRAFTLLEMIIALFIVTLLLGMAVTATRDVMAHEGIRQANRQLQTFAKTARNQAFAESRPWKIIFRPDSWLLLPAGAIGIVEKAPLEYKLPKQVHWQVKPWGAKDWISPSETSWIFPRDGICPPLQIRLMQESSWIQMSFNPLTANPQDEEFYLP